MGRPSRRAATNEPKAASEEKAELTLEQVGSLKVAGLKEALEARALSTKGKKAELVKRLSEAISESGSSKPVEGEEEQPTGVAAPTEVNSGAEQTDAAAPSVASAAEEECPPNSAAEPQIATDDMVPNSTENTEQPEAGVDEGAPKDEKAGVASDKAKSAPEPAQTETEEIQRSNSNTPPRKRPSESVQDTDRSAKVAVDDDKVDEPTSSTAKRQRVMSQEERSEVEEQANEAAEAVPEEVVKEGSTWVLISNLRRPFTLNMLRAMVEEFGPLAEGDGNFKTDRFRTFCAVQYAHSADALRATSELDGVQWPAETGLVLTANSHDSDPAGDGCQAHPRAKPRARSPSPRPDLAPAVDALNVSQEEAVKTLEELFRKTKADPPLYWLPVSTDEVESRKRRREENRDDGRWRGRTDDHRRRSPDDYYSRSRDYSRGRPGNYGSGYRGGYRR